MNAAYRMNTCTAPVNMAGLPGITVPFAQHNGLPIGLQLIGRPFGEEALFTAATALEQPRLLPPDILKQARDKGVQA
jgi:aspartyl-tRNA(Asn)/glutamyl-tRNA(Gln) amidotransferase subunit A